MQIPSLKFRDPVNRQDILARLLVLVTVFCLLLNVSGSVDSAEMAVPVVEDLSRDGAEARANRLVILVEFSSDSCEYCRLLESEFLEPMMLNQDYRSRVMIRSLPLDDERQFNGFAGELVTAGTLAEKYQVTVTPTMVFLDADGVELSERLVGIWSVDYFGGYIDQRIDAAREKLL